MHLSTAQQGTIAMRARIHWMVVVTVVSAGACAAAESSDTVVVSDSAGITVVSVPERLLTEAPSKHLEARLVTIGGSADDDLAWITSVILLEDGSIAFINGAGTEVRVHAANGDLLTSFGRSGDGPGEFRVPWQIFRWSSDSLAVWDVEHRRVSIFSPEGVLGRSMQMPMLDGGQPAVHGTMANGYVLASMEDRYKQRDQNRVRRDTLDLYRVASAEESVWAGRYPGQAQYEMAVPPVVLLEEAPFGPFSSVGVMHDRVSIADNGSAQIAEMDSVGTVKRLIRLDLAGKPVTAEDRRSFEVAHIDESWRPTYLAAKRQFLAEAPIPAEMPRMGEMIVGSDQSYWIAEYVPAHQRRTAPRSWWVLSPTGEVQGRVVTPERFVLHGATRDRVFGVQQDDLGVETVVVFALPF